MWLVSGKVEFNACQVLLYAVAQLLLSSKPMNFTAPSPVRPLSPPSDPHMHYGDLYINKDYILSIIRSSVNKLYK